MERKHFIGLDVHCQATEIAVITARGRLTKRMRVPTTIPALVEALHSVRRPRHVVLEEGVLADWLIRNLTPHVEEIVACDPRRNRVRQANRIMAQLRRQGIIRLLSNTGDGSMRDGPLAWRVAMWLAVRRQ